MVAMTSVMEIFLLFYFVTLQPLVSSVNHPPKVESITGGFPRIPATDEMDTYWGGSNVHFNTNGSNADIVLDRSSGSGLVSKHTYHHGLFSAAIKLPGGIVTSGVVLAFYASNVDVYPNNHDEIDFELLGHEKGGRWFLQTNIYGNGSVHTGREDKMSLWFDPSQAFHQYTILWNKHHILFLVDNIPIREVVYNEAISPAYPSKPMKVMVTIWDGSDWATHGGMSPVDYNYAPFVASLGEMVMQGCVTPETSPPTAAVHVCLRLEGQDYATLSEQQRVGLDWVKRHYRVYSYCEDKRRYKVLPAECKPH